MSGMERENCRVEWLCSKLDCQCSLSEQDASNSAHFSVVVLPVSYENTQAMTDFLIDSVGTGCDNNQQDCL